MVRSSDAVVTTNALRAGVLERRWHVSGVHVLGNVPASVPHVEPLDPGFPTGVPVLLYQGGLYPRGRAYRESIQALRYLRDLHFVILGFGRASDFALVRSSAEAASVSPRVHFLPPQPFDALVRVAAAATVGIVPIKPIDLSSYTIDTNKLFEYLMAGLPVVASDLPEIRRVIAWERRPRASSSTRRTRGASPARSHGSSRIHTSTRPAVARRAASPSSTSTGASTSAGCSTCTPPCRTSAFVARRPEPLLERSRNRPRGFLAVLVEVEEVQERYGASPPRRGGPRRACPTCRVGPQPPARRRLPAGASARPRP